MKILILSFVVSAFAVFTSQVGDPPPFPTGNVTLKYDNSDIAPIDGFIKKLPDGAAADYAFGLDNGEAGLITYHRSLNQYEMRCEEPPVRRLIWWDEDKKQWRFRHIGMAFQETGTLEFADDSDDSDDDG